MPSCRFLLTAFFAASLCGAPSLASPAVSVDGDRLVDPTGRTVYLRGMNVGSKSPTNRHLSWQTPEDFQRLRSWGMTAVRYMIFWSAVEPSPGEYDEEYLRGVDERVAWARAAGIHVILDMHQDLYGPAIPGGNGMPAWATLDDGLPHRTVGGVWSTAYFVSPKIHRAFDNFWQNAPGPDGVGIQDRFALAWRHVAARYRDEPTVIGFDLLNEPFIGSDIRRVGWAVWMALPDILRGADLPRNPRAFFASLKEEPYPSWLLEVAEDPVRYERFLAAVTPAMQAFERERLLPMYQRVRRAVREVHLTGIFFLEPCVLANVGAVSALEPLTDDEGRRDPFQAYMPHFYDIVLDTSLAHAPSRTRLEIMMRNRAAEARRLGMPLLVGEWGAFYGNDRCADAAALMAGLLAANTCGEFYWEYHQGMEKTAYLPSLNRPSPLLLNGRPLTVHADLAAGRFDAEWQEDADIPSGSVFHVPESWGIAAAAGETASDGNAAASGDLTLPPTGGETHRTLSLRRKP